jgi:hypothetical protein
MSVSFHSLLLFHRTVILLLLGLLLPMQSTLAYARSIAMLTPVSSIHVMTPAPAAQETDQHHHDYHDTADHSAHLVTATVISEHSSVQPHHPNVAGKRCHTPAKNSSACDDCAKCCLIGAAAPPSCGLTAQTRETTRTVFTTTTHPLSGFIPDGLERPPRTFHT